MTKDIFIWGSWFVFGVLMTLGVMEIHAQRETEKLYNEVRQARVELNEFKTLAYPCLRCHKEE